MWQTEQLAGIAYIYAMSYSYSLRYSFLFYFFIPVFIVEIYVAPEYMDQKFIVLCHVSL